MGLTTQFHALPQELIDFAATCASRLNLFVVAICYFPEKKVKFRGTADRVKRRLAEFPKLNEILLTLKDPGAMRVGRLELSTKATNGLLFQVGQLKDGVLGESHIASTTRDPSSLRVWRSVAREWKEQTKTGAWAVSLASGVHEYYADLRYSSGAKTAARRGVKLRIGPGVEIRFRRPGSRTSRPAVRNCTRASRRPARSTRRR